MKIFLTILFLSINYFLSAQNYQAVRTELSKLSSAENLKNASIGFYAIDLDSGGVIAGLSPNKSLIPASTMKLITTATALELYGSKKRFITEVMYSGKLDTNKRILHGNIYIKGGGDPCLGSFRFKKHYGNFMNNWADEIIKLGIDSINGRVIGDATIFNNEMIPSTWIWADLGNYYGAGASGLSIYENTCNLEITSGKNKNDSTIITCVSPYIPELDFDNKVVSLNVSKDQSYIMGGPYQDKRLIKGGIPINKTNYRVRGSIPDPAYLTAFELDMELRGKGVRIANTSTTIRKIEIEEGIKNIPNSNKQSITSTYSPTLGAIISKTNTHSINLYAEHLMNFIGVKKYQQGNTDAGTMGTTSFWKKKGVDVDGMYINDGSGLSRFNAITAKQLVDILKYMKSSKNYTEFVRSLPVSGKTGTMRNVGRGTVISGKIRAKSGSMTRVKSYAGYIATASGKTLAFALIVNNYNGPSYLVKKKMIQLMIRLVNI